MDKLQEFQIAVDIQDAKDKKKAIVNAVCNLYKESNSIIADNTDNIELTNDDYLTIKRIIKFCAYVLQANID